MWGIHVVTNPKDGSVSLVINSNATNGDVQEMSEKEYAAFMEKTAQVHNAVERKRK